MYRPFVGSSPASSAFLDVESTIRNLTQDYSTAFNTGNYDQVSAMFASDGLLMTPRHDAVQGPKTVERVLRSIGELGYRDLRFETLRVDHSDDMAVEIGQYTLTVPGSNGSATIENGRFVHAWRRLGAWLMIVDSWSSNLPPLTRQAA